MTLEPGSDDSEPEEDWSDIQFRGYTQFPVVADPDDLELPEPAAAPPAEARQNGAADDAG
ncbi:hypothetical protein [Paractinoplanes toevensis]|uniref:Uncharacterized protein n=1 Tax=Paractinoplanes toevensis TaxID=571911 RepID=A0A919W1Q7_9ACTN|nr:hypothetical protein [Actinoplanes toevensis]GIM88715.1 hypothetical protein Ato02nite_005080 [Actinoplanes toevensis]